MPQIHPPPEKALIFTGYGQPYKMTRPLCEWMEYHGVLPERCELVDGLVYPVFGRTSRHGAVVIAILVYLMEALGKQRILPHVSIEVPTEEQDLNFPEADVTVTRPTVGTGEYLSYEEVELVVEIADFTLAKDKGPKARLYARCGIPEYWVLDVNGGTLTVYRQPDTATGTWADEKEYRGEDSVAPLSAPDATTTVSALLP